MIAQEKMPTMIQPQRPLPLLGGLSPSQFMRRHWQKKPLLVRGAWPEAAPPLPRAALFELAARGDVESRLVVRAGRDWTLRRGPLPRRALPPLQIPNWTLLVQGLDLHVEAAHALLSRFRFVPDARLDDLMLSYASAGGGVGPHLDSYDVFLVQVAGQRRWRWGRCPQPRLRSGVPLKILSNFAPMHDAVLSPGDLLYLPPGWAHDGTAVGGDCMTASIGFRAPAAAELASALLDRLVDDVDEAPSSLYRDAAQAATARPGEVPHALQDFARRAVGRALADGAIERVLGEWLTEPKAQVVFDGAGTAILRPGDGVVLDRRTRMSYDARQIFINGDSFSAGGRDATLVRRLADARGLEATQLRGLSAGARALLAQWQAAGWLHARPQTGDGDDG
jgi:50S ribosomal protein L16 3-hydroxylase